MSASEGVFFSPPARSFPIELGGIIFYVQSWQLTGQRIFAEQAAADGADIVTNCSQRFRRLILEGLWVTDTEPDSLILQLDSFISDNTAFALNLRQLCFEECRLMKYTAAEKGSEPFINIRLELLAIVPPKEAQTDEL